MKDLGLYAYLRCRKTLYPTWFRWKRHFWWFFWGFRANLYIPHGSDESGSGYIVHKMRSDFISHMVQMKVKTVHSRKFHHKRLYIPHGSDERSPCSSISFSRPSFISHMVQMKGGYWQCGVVQNFLFISHMVQMKVILAVFFLFQYRHFISHMVQMKGFLPMTSKPFASLYIPHGSDERLQEGGK